MSVHLGGCAGSPSKATGASALRSAQRCRAVRHIPGNVEAVHPGPMPETDVPDDVARVAHAGRLLPQLIEPGLDVDIVLGVLRMQNEISAAVAQIDCLGDATDDLQDQLLRQRNATEQTFTLSSIGLAVLTGVAAGIVELIHRDSPAAPIIAISGGLGSAGLGVAAAVPRAPVIRLAHVDNVLYAIWRPIAEHLTRPPPLPVTAWRLLHTARGDGLVPRDVLRDEWDQILDDSAPTPLARERLERLLFGTGGDYDLSALRAREAMLDRLETALDLMHQDLERLLQFLRRRTGVQESKAEEL